MLQVYFRHFDGLPAKIPISMYVSQSKCVDPGHVLYVQADGHELEYIHACGYPIHGGLVQQYWGSNAQQIVANWE